MEPSISESRPPKERRSRIRYGVITWFSVAAAIAYLCRTGLGVAESTVRADLELTEAQMGLILGPAFFWTYALGQIPMAWLGTRWGSRKLVPWLAVMWSAGTMLTSFCTSLLPLVVVRGATGIGQAGLFPCATASFARWLPITERAMASGMLAACMSLGAALGGAVTGVLLDEIGWRAIFIGYGVIGLLWAVGFAVRFRNDPSEDPRVTESERKLIGAGQTDESSDDHETNRTPWLALMLSPAMWMICGQQFFRAAAYVFFASWFATWLQETRGVSTGESGLLLTLPLIATVLSSVFGGVASDWALRVTGSLRVARQGVAVVFLVLCAVLVLAAFFVQDAVTAVLIISLGVFCAGFAGPCGYAVTMDMGGRHVAVVFSTMNMVGNFGAGWLPWFLPYFRRWLERHPAWLEWLGGSSWDAVLLLFVVLYLLAALFWWLLVPRGTVLDQSWLRKAVANA